MVMLHGGRTGGRGVENLGVRGWSFSLRLGRISRMLDPDARPECLGDALEPGLKFEAEVEPSVRIEVSLPTGSGHRVLRERRISSRGSCPLGDLRLLRLSKKVDDFGDQPDEAVGGLVFL